MVDSGQLKVGWEVKKLGDVCQLDKSQGIYKNLPYVGMENIESNSARFIGSIEPQSVKSSTFKFTPEHILYGRLRPYLNKVLAPEFEGHCSTEIFPIKTSEYLDRNFLLYWFLMESTVKLINATCTGARMPRANMNVVFEFEFPTPPLAEQKRIVAILDEAFEGCDRAIRNTEKNLANAREIFESYLNAIFTQKGDQWVEKKLDEIAGKVFTGPFGSLLHKSDYISDGIPIVNPANIEGDKIIPNFNKTISQDVAIRMSAYILKYNDVVVGRRGEIGRCAVVREDQAGWLCGSGSFFIKPFKNVNSTFLAHLLRSFPYRSKLEKLASGATMLNLSNQSLSELILTMPSLDEQNQITSKLNDLRIETQRLETIYRQKLAALKELKQSILQKAFTGELTADKEVA